MICNDARELFSAHCDDQLGDDKLGDDKLGDGPLDAHTSAELEAHCAECATCRTEREQLLHATRSLRTLRAAPAPQAHLAAVMAAVEAASVSAAPVPAGAPRPVDAFAPRRLVSHAIAVLLGAAAAWLLFALGVGTVAPVEPEVALASLTQNARVAVRVSGGAVTLHRAERSWELTDSETIELEPGDRLEAPGPRALTVGIDPDGVLALAAPAVAEAEPRIVTRTVIVPRPLVRTEPRLVLRPVEVVRTVEVGPDPAELAARARERETHAAIAAGLARTVAILDLVRGALAVEHARRGERPRGAYLAAMTGGEPEQAPSDTPPDVERRPRGPSPAIARADPPRRAPEEVRDGAPVRIRREGDDLSLTTRGSLSVVVPALISRLDDDDREVRRLVDQRLSEIREDLARRHGVGEVPGRGRPQSGSTGAAVPLGRFFGVTPVRTESPPDSPTEAWARWWSASSEALANHDPRGR